MEERKYWVYLLANRTDQVLYVGVTNDLEQRLREHRSGQIAGFSLRYNTRKLVWFETLPDIEAALLREQEIRGWRRERKARLVETINPEWRDLAPD